MADSPTKMELASAHKAAERLAGSLCTLRAFGDLLAVPPTPIQVEVFRKVHLLMLSEVRALADAVSPVLGELTTTAAKMNSNGVVSACGENGANAHDVIYKIGNGLILGLLCALGSEAGAEPGSTVQCRLSASNHQHVQRTLSCLDRDELKRLEGQARQESILTWERIRKAADNRRIRAVSGRKTVPAEPLPVASDAWCHSPDEPKPDHFTFGPLTGKAKTLNRCFTQKKDRNNKALKAKGRSGRIWIVPRDRYCCEMWFQKQGEYDVAKRKLDALEN